MAGSCEKQFAGLAAPCGKACIVYCELALKAFRAQQIGFVVIAKAMHNKGHILAWPAFSNAGAIPAVLPPAFAFRRLGTEMD